VQIQIIYEDETLVAINKPNGLMTHKSSINKYAKTAALQLLRDTINQRVYTTHRLDSKTSGLLIFTKDKETGTILNKMFANYEIEKKYIGIVRGWVDDSATIDYPIKNDKAVLKNAVTNYTCLQKTERPFQTSKFKTSRYSLVELKPETGRYHQLRMHLAHIFHPIINDRPHGCNKQNRYFKHQHQINEMMLHARSLTFAHPKTNITICIEAPFLDPFINFSKLMGFELSNI